MSSVRIAAGVVFAGFLLLWSFGLVWFVAAGVRAPGIGLFCGLPLVAAGALFAVVIARTRRHAQR